ncbi:MAG: N-acetylmuramoyl-L-alanine amidase [Desulfitobacterium hafniense]|nr:N-acetylmuramoyl-L-alanine amidase [Desulfitobacterium hafniense]
MPKICIDPGHNASGADTGAQGNGLKEADLNLDIARKLRRLLEANGLQVIMTRDGEFVNGPHSTVNESLKTRCDIANSFGADLFVSIHINAGGGTGSEIYALPGGQAVVAAQRVLDRLIYACNWANRGVKTNHEFYVLVHTDMPAILTENGFIDSQDANKISTEEFRQIIAEAHAKGICDFFGIAYGAPSQPVMYRVILDGLQIMALNSEETAISQVKEAVNNGRAQTGIVQRNTDGKNTFVYALPTQSTPSTPSTQVPEIPQHTPSRTKTPIMGTETITIEQCRSFLLRRNPNAPDIIPLYKKYGEILGIRWGYAVAQMIKETGFLGFGGSVGAGQNNFAGIGAVAAGVQGASFQTPEEGVLAHLEHLYAYASTSQLPMGLFKVDPRFDLVTRGSCPNWEDLNGHWAVPGDGYGEDIVRIYIQMASEIVVPVEPAKSTPLTAVKPWYDSKTLWVNFVMIAGILAQQLSGTDLFTPEVEASIIAVVNVILRAITKDKITWKQ